MSPSAHPSVRTLLRFAAGHLPAGPKLVVDAHIAGCPECRALVRRFESVGGALLEETAPDALAPDALARVLARLDAPVPAVAAPTLRPLPAGLVLPPGIALPAAVARRRISALIPVAPGVRVGRVEVPEDPSSTVLLLRIGPGRSIPDHTHTGNEFTQVISGAFRDASGRYGPGDLAEADGEVDHSPVVEEGAECVCIAAFEGRLRFHGLLGVALRPFI